MRIDKNWLLWLGNEFGPFLINVDTSGKVTRQKVLLRAASFHHFWFFYKAIGSLRYYQALELLAISLLFSGIFDQSKLVKLNHNNKSEINNIIEI